MRCSLRCFIVAVTADSLETGSFSIMGEATEEGDEQAAEETTQQEQQHVEEEEDPVVKKIKLEVPDDDSPQEQPTENITLENGLVFGICK